MMIFIIDLKGTLFFPMGAILNCEKKDSKKLTASFIRFSHKTIQTPWLHARYTLTADSLHGPHETLHGLQKTISHAF